MYHDFPSTLYKINYCRLTATTLCVAETLYYNVYKARENGELIILAMVQVNPT